MPALTGSQHSVSTSSALDYSLFRSRQAVTAAKRQQYGHSSPQRIALAWLGTERGRKDIPLERRGALEQSRDLEFRPRILV